MFQKLLLLFCFVLLTTRAVQASESSPLFTLSGDQPVVPHGLSGGWDSGYVNPGAMIYADGQFCMLRNGFRTWPGQVDTGETVSEDGITWTAVGDQPVFTTRDVPYARLLAMASSLLRNEDGSWVLYFYTWKNRGYPQQGAVGRATAASLAGPWVIDPQPVLEIGAKGAWDDGHIEVPFVIHNADGYSLYYSGFGGHNLSQIGLATSDDGIHWTKADAPVLTPGAESSDWDHSGVGRPRVVQTPEGWVMLYRNPTSTDLGLARSDDGLHWIKDTRNPVVVPAQIPHGDSYWIYDLLYHDDRYSLYTEAVTSDPSSSDVFLLTHQGNLFDG